MGSSNAFKLPDGYMEAMVLDTEVFMANQRRRQQEIRDRKRREAELENVKKQEDEEAIKKTKKKDKDKKEKTSSKKSSSKKSSKETSKKNKNNSKKKKSKSNNVIDFNAIEKLKRKEEKEVRRLMEQERREKEEALRLAEEERLRKEEEKKQAEVDIIQLIARRDYLKGQLSKLNPYKRKDAIKIATINVELNNIEQAMQTLRNEYGIQRREIEQGSWASRTFNKIKTKVGNFWRKAKKFVKKNLEVILGVASIIVPFVGSIIVNIIKK